MYKYHGKSNTQPRRQPNPRRQVPIATYSAATFRREFSEVGSERSPQKATVVHRSTSAPMAATSPSRVHGAALQGISPARRRLNGHRTEARTGGGGLAAARQLRNTKQFSHSTQPPKQHNNYITGQRTAQSKGMTLPRLSPRSHLHQTDYPDHPLYEKLKTLTLKKQQLLDRINLDKQQIAALQKQIKTAQTLAETTLTEKERLLEKKRSLIQQREKVLGLGNATSAKSTLNEKTANLQVLKNDYQCIMAALRQLESSKGTNGAMNKTSAARMKLQSNLDRKRLIDEEQCIIKYDFQCQKLRSEIDGLRTYQGRLEAAGGNPKEVPPGDFLLNVPQELSPTRSGIINAKLELKRKEIEALKLQFNQEERQLDVELQQEEMRVGNALEEANMKVLSAQHATEAQQSQIASLRAAITSKMAIAVQKKNETELIQSKIVNLERQIATAEAKLVAVEEAFHAGGQSLEAAKLVHAAALSNNVREQKQSEDLIKQETAAVISQIKAAEQQLSDALAAKEKVNKRIKANAERWSQQEGSRKRQIEVLERTKAQQMEHRQNLEELLAAHAKDLESSAFITQKSSIISELRTKYDKESIKLADLEKQNAQLEKTLAATVELLKRNNVEVLF